MKRYLKSSVLVMIAGIVIGSFIPGISFAITGREIIEKVNSHPEPSGTQGKLVMRLISRTGGVRERVLQSYSKTTKEGLEKRYVKFIEPADVAGTSFLTLEQKKGSDLQYLYLPVLHKVRRIEASGKKGSFMGSDFTYKDMESIKIDEWKYRLLKKENYNGLECYVVEEKPANKEVLRETGYSKRISWVDSKNFLIRKVEFYDEMGNLLKVLSLEDYKLFSGKYWIAQRMVMKNVQTKHTTELIFKEMKAGNIKIPDLYFTPRYLMRG